MIAWLPTLACVALLALVLAWRTPASRSSRSSSSKLALLYGIQRRWGETADSVRTRSAAAARSSFHTPAPRFVWWARLARRVFAKLFG